MSDWQQRARDELARHSVFPPAGVITAYTLAQCGAYGQGWIVVYLEDQEVAYERSIEDFPKCPA